MHATLRLDFVMKLITDKSLVTCTIPSVCENAKLPLDKCMQDPSNQEKYLVTCTN